MRMKLLFAAFASLTVLSACKDRDDSPTPVKHPVSADTPNHFLRVPDEQRSLGAGYYQWVAATSAAGMSGTYRLLVEYDNGQRETINGSWSNSGGQDPFNSGNPRHGLRMNKAGGVKARLFSSVDAYLYLLRNDHVVARDDNSAGGTNAQIDLPADKINSEAYAQAYYRRVDPHNRRTTLSDWKQANGFDNGEDAHVIFRDARDLGYGRNMHARRNADGTFAFFVENYVVRNIPGASNYGPLNVEAAVAEDHRYLLGINAIEFSPIDEDDPDSEKVLKFFTFRPESTGPNYTAHRLLSADLDGRGVKSMPGICLTCHGARILPLNADGSFPDDTIRSAKFNQLEPDFFEYSKAAGYSRNDLEPGIRTINSIVHDAYQRLSERPDNEAGKWAADFSLMLANGRYDGDFSNGLFRPEYVPDGWKQTADRPEGVEQLFKRVIEPHCISCHALQGNAAGAAQLVDVNGKMVSLANAVNFSSYEQFIANSDRVTDYVFRRGWMPLSLRNYESFWKNPDGAPALLASFLPGFDLYDQQGKVHEAGAPVAKPGADRSVRSPVTLDASASLFAQSFEWSVVAAPAGATMGFDKTSAASPIFTADRDGSYIIALTVRNAKGLSHTAQLHLTLDSKLKHQGKLNFVDDIRPILGSSSNTECSQCHTADTPHPGIPVRYDDGNASLYHDVLARVNLADPENSRLLRKPTTARHGGGVRINLNTDTGRQTYNTLLNWIREGAVCGDNPAICP